MSSQCRAAAASIRKNSANLLLSRPAAPSSPLVFAQTTLKGREFSGRCCTSCFTEPSVDQKKKEKHSQGYLKILALARRRFHSDTTLDGFLCLALLQNSIFFFKLRTEVWVKVCDEANKYSYSCYLLEHCWSVALSVFLLTQGQWK